MPEAAGQALDSVFGFRVSDHEPRGLYPVQTLGYQAALLDDSTHFLPRIPDATGIQPAGALRVRLGTLLWGHPIFTEVGEEHPPGIEALRDAPETGAGQVGEGMGKNALDQGEVKLYPETADGEVVHVAEGGLFYFHEVSPEFVPNPLFDDPLVGLYAEVVARPQVGYEHPAGA